MPSLLRLLAFASVALCTSSGTESTISDESTSYASSLTDIPTGDRATYGEYGSQTETILTSQNSTTSSSGSSSAIVSGNGTITSTSTTTTATRTTFSGTNSRSSSYPTNAAKCNGYVDFCGRKYSNVTYVVAHNSPFHIKGNAASNQDYDVITQLNDGIRGIQSETHYVNDTVMLCHTSCSELNAGTLEEYLVKVKSWLDSDLNRNEVITILLGNEDFIDPGNYTAPVTNSGILDYIYTPLAQPMDIDGWPTLGEMIVTNKRVVIMLAYDANQQQIPWLLDFWSYQWQTPFSPTNVSFPCTVQRPPGQSRNVSEKRLILANHNLNIQFDDAALGINILIPNTAVINNTNANTTDLGAASAMVNQCAAEWGRPPNYLLVDYYNQGIFPGSVLAAAAEANNVTYDVNSCCGHTTESAAVSMVRISWLGLYGVVGLVVVLGSF